MDTRTDKDRSQREAGRGDFRPWALRILPAIVGVGASIWWISGAGIVAALRGCRFAPMAAGMVLQAGAGMVLGFRWRSVLESVGASLIPTRRAAAVLSLRAQAAVVLAPGGIGMEVMRGYEAGYRQEMLGRLAKVAILERVVGAGMLTIVALASTLPLVYRGWGGTTAAALVVALLLGGVLLPGSVSIAGARLRIKPVLGWTIANQILALAGLAAGLVATGVRAPAAALVSIAAVAAFAAMVPVSFNGYGVREFALALLAPRLGLDSKVLAAAGLVASTILLAGLMTAALGARMIPTGTPGFELAHGSERTGSTEPRN